MSENKGADATGKVAGDVQSLGDAARQTGEQARQAGADALDHARDVVQEAQSRASSVASTLSEHAASVAESQKADLADALEDISKAVHRSGEQLEGHQDWIAHLVERGAAELNALATTLRRNDLQGLLSDLGSLSRRQPALFVGASMAAGFALTRIGRLAVEGTPRTGPATLGPTASTAADREPTSTPEAVHERS